MLKIIGSIGSVANPKETEDEASGNSIVGSNEVTNQINPIEEKKQAKTTKSKNLVKSKNHDFSFNSRNREAGKRFLTPEARLAFA